MQSKSRIERSLKELELTDEEREKLEPIARRPKTAQRMVLRARIILLFGIRPIQLGRLRAVRRLDGAQRCTGVRMRTSVQHARA